MAYDPKVVTIWDGFRAWFRAQGLPFTYILYADYEKQAEDLMAGHIDIAWNSPLAWVRSRRLAAAEGANVSVVALRDSDCDLTSLIVVRADSDVRTLEDLRGRRVGTGAIDSPQATLIPLEYIKAASLVAGRDFEVRRFDIGVGLHGDHVGGEREAARALMTGEIDATCMLDSNHLAFTREGVLPAGATRVLAQTQPFDHCAMTAGPAAPAGMLERFRELLFSMSYGDPIVRPLLDLEGLKEWRPGRTTGYAQLEQAASDLGFYDDKGNVVTDGYRP